MFNKYSPPSEEHQFKKSTTGIKYDLTSRITTIEKDKRRSDVTTLLEKDNNIHD
jgi:hypothetical protein